MDFNSNFEIIEELIQKEKGRLNWSYIEKTVKEDGVKNWFRFEKTNYGTKRAIKFWR